MCFCEAFTIWFVVLTFFFEDSTVCVCVCSFWGRKGEVTVKDNGGSVSSESGCGVWSGGDSDEVTECRLHRLACLGGEREREKERGGGGGGKIVVIHKVDHHLTYKTSLTPPHLLALTNVFCPREL